MLTRVVKMHFESDFVNEFQDVFKAVQPKIVAFNGCNGVQLLQDKSNKSIFFTISIWQNQDALETYRQSDLFKATWSIVKPRFKHKAEAWSLLNV